MTQVSYQWNGNNLAEVKRWLKDLKPEITVSTNEFSTETLEIKNDDNIIQVTVGDYIVRNYNDMLEVSFNLVGELHTTEEIDLSELSHRRMTATILAALYFTQANMDDDILEMSLFNEIDCLDYNEISLLCDRIISSGLLLK